MTSEMLNAIRPTKDGKFSPRLHSWLKWFTGRRFSNQVRPTPPYWQPEAIMSRIEVRQVAKKSKLRKRPYIVIPFGEDFLGSSIPSIRISRKNDSYMSFASDLGPPIKGFWKQYLKLGICYLDKDHSYLNGDRPWKYSKNKKERTCSICGHRQKLVTRTERRKLETWENISASGTGAIQCAKPV